MHTPKRDTKSNDITSLPHPIGKKIGGRPRIRGRGTADQGFSVVC